LKKERKTKKKGLTASHPSLKGQTHQCMQPQEHWVGVHRESNLPLALVCITDYQCSGCRPGIQESNVYRAAQTRTCTQLLGRQTFRSQSASECTTL